MAERNNLKGEFELIIALGKKGEQGSISVAQLLNQPQGNAPTFDFTSPYGDNISLPIPEGSFKAYIEKHKEQYSGPDPYIFIYAKYHRAPGEKTPLPPGAKTQEHSVSEMPTLERLSAESERRHKGS